MKKDVALNGLTGNLAVTGGEMEFGLWWAFYFSETLAEGYLKDNR
ncbi:hypothetical protein [Agrobacterium leguminum]